MPWTGTTCGSRSPGCGGSPGGARNQPAGDQAGRNQAAGQRSARKRWIMAGVYPRDMAIRPVEEKDRPTVEWLTTQLWGAPEVAVHDGVFYPAALPGFIAERAGRIAGLVTYEVRGDILEIATINALNQHQGIGTLLIEAVRAEARRLGCQHVTL